MKLFLTPTHFLLNTALQSNKKIQKMKTIRSKKYYFQIVGKLLEFEKQNWGSSVNDEAFLTKHIFLLHF